MTSSLRILHNPACSTSRHALESAREAGAEPEVVPYLKTPLDRADVLALLAILQDQPADLVRKDRFFHDQGLDADDYVTAEQVADLLVQHPRLMERPVLVRGDRAVIGRPKSRAEAFVRE
jgi:arsenate reductase